MNPNAVQTPAMTPQVPPVMPSTPQPQPQQSQPQAQIGGRKSGSKSAQMPSRPFTPADHHVYDALRNTLMNLVKQGVPGIEDVLTALNNSHVNGMKSQQQQPPQMPQQPMGVPPGTEVGQVVRPPMMPVGGQ